MNNKTAKPGYYREKGRGKKDSVLSYLVYLGNEECYCPIGQHSACSADYILNDCIRITKEEYTEATNGFYTPEDYLK